VDGSATDGQDVARFVARLGAAAAAAPSGAREEWVALGPCAVRLSFATERLATLLMPALAHRRVGPAAAPWLTIRCLDDALDLRSPWPRAAFARTGDVGAAAGAAARVRFDHVVGALYAFDRPARTAYLWAGGRALPPWSLAAPFLQILHWACEGTALQPVHAGAVGRAHGGVLIAGPSGSGKSFCALACAAAGLGYAGDDYVLADCGPPAQVHGLYAAAKLAPAALAQLGIAAPGDAVHHGKAILTGAVPGRLLPGFPLRAIVVRLPTDAPLALTRVAAARAVRTLLPDTVAQLRGLRDPILGKLARLAAAVPCHALAGRGTPAALAAAIGGLIDGGGA
jgi:hypothetical protein